VHPTRDHDRHETFSSDRAFPVQPSS